MSGEIKERTFSDLAGFHHKQTLALKMLYEGSPNTQLLVGGAGFGGKSRFLRGASIHHQLWLHSKGFYLPSVFASASYEALRDRHYAKFAQEWGSMGTIKKDDKQYGRCFRFKNDNIAPICLRNLSSAEERRGSEYAAGFLDELTEILQDVYGDFCYMIRSPGPERHPIAAGTNPDGIGHNWVKSMWRPNIPETERLKPFPSRIDPDGNIDPLDYKYLAFLPDDNPQFNEKRFWRAVSSLADHIQRSRRWGLWDAPEGARFATLREDTHLFNFKKRFPYGIPSNYPVILGIDYGLRAPYCCLWITFDEDGNAYVFKEDYKPGFTADAQALRVAEMTPPGLKIAKAYLDPAMWQVLPGHLGKTEISTADMYTDILCKLPNFPKSLTPGWNRSRVHCLTTLDKYLNHSNEYPNLYIEEGCQALWGELTGAIFKKGAGLREFSEDIDERCADHAITALYYALHSHANPSVIIPKDESYEAIIQRHIQLREKALEVEANKVFEREVRRLKL